MKISLRSRRTWFLTLALLALTFSTSCFAQADPPIPSGSIRIHYFRADGNYLGWTVYAFGDTTEPNNWGAGPVAVTGTDSFGAYFDVGVTTGAANVGIIVHKGNTKDPGPNEYADPATQGNEYWQLSGSDILQTTQPPTIQATDPAIPAGKVRIHYNRPDNNYGGWSIYSFGAGTDPNSSWCNTEDYISGYDTYGAYYDVGADPTLNGGDLGFIIHNCQANVKDPGPDMHLQVNQFTSAWVLSGAATVFTSQPVTEYTTDPPIPAGHARIHYYRPDGSYGGWSLYPFFATSDPTGNWCNTEDYVSGYDSYGAFYDVGITTGTLGFIIHNCSTGVKDPGPDMHLQVPDYLQAWVVSGDANVFLSQPTAAQLLSGVFNQLQAYWLDATTVALQSQYFQSGWTYALNYSPAASLQLALTGITGGTAIPLTPYAGSLTADQALRYPQLAGYALFKLPSNLDPGVIPQAVESQLAVSALGPDGALKYATGMQIFGVLDDRFNYSGRLGVLFRRATDPTWFDFPDDAGFPLKIKLWAPTAQSANLLLYNAPTDTTPAKTVAMHSHHGVWVADGEVDWRGKYYLFNVNVYVASAQAIVSNTTTDPYSIDLAINGTMSRITDLDAESTKPGDWDESASPPLNSVNDMSIYELHVRDFSVADPTVPASLQGTYEAFALPNSNGMRHLRALARSGLKAIHIMPSFHFDAINEDKSTWQSPGNLSPYPPDGQQQQAAVAAVQNNDAYNWGYNPHHYMAPEGAYAVNPNNRIREYRQMVQGLHSAGLRVIQDVVFNHTSASGNTFAANLDMLVPNYYHRLDANGSQLTGSCCADTASEHRMFEKLMIDTLLLNAKQYKIDGFRFDEMSMHFTYNMANIKAALGALTPQADGLDGSKIYLYGEGWQMAEAANNAIGPNASQVNMYGSGIGTFNDRIRDGIRGGGPFGDQRDQGFATGLATDPSAYTSAATPAPAQLATLLAQSDWIRLGLAGNMRDYTLVNAQGQAVPGSQIIYGGQPAGYTASPIEDINYCSVHDNQTLFDVVQLKSSLSDDISARARRQVLAMSLVALGQGVPFFQAGDDLLRSKDMDNNSYDSGDWFNKIDFSFQTANWGIGLPIASQNQAQWPIMQPLLANPALAPTPQNISATTQAFQEFMAIRYSSGLFRMATLNEVENYLSFLNTGPSQTPGLIVMRLDDHGSNYGKYHHIVVFFNGGNTQVTFTDASLAGMHLHLHPVQDGSSDPVVKQARFKSQQGTATIPALTTAVFVSDSE
ncbi:MAG TPA: pullulanase-type alpha-1,6-glucosidase [Terracidiphilus sp.]